MRDDEVWARVASAAADKGLRAAHHQALSALPKSPEAQVLGHQLLRSGTSVGANYREGNCARSDAEMAAKFSVCIQELDETAYWIELLIEAGLVDEQLLTPLLDETSQLIAMFTAAVRKLRGSGKGGAS